MIDVSAGLERGRKMGQPRPAIVQDHFEIIIRNAFDDLTDVTRGKGDDRAGRDEAGGRLGDDNTTRPGTFERIGIGDEEGGRFLQQGMEHFRLIQRVL